MTLEARIVINLVPYPPISTCIPYDLHVFLLQFQDIIHKSIVCGFNLLQILFVLFGCVGGYVSARVYKSESGL